jgi:hypothetical protein
MQETLQSMAAALDALRGTLAKLPLPKSVTLEELTRALDIAWISAIRLAAELDDSAQT